MDEYMSSNKKEYNNQVQWSELPFLPLEKIYSFLSRDDQVAMSLVCRKWSEGFSSPSVWKTFKFALTVSQLSMDSYPVMKFAEKYSCMFRHVQIECSFIEKKHLIETWFRHFKSFLRILTRNSQLISFKIENFVYYFKDINPSRYEDICRDIADFLGSQHCLKRVEFYHCCFNYQDSVQFLKQLTKSSKESLAHLVLRGFVHSESYDKEQDSTDSQNLPTLISLPSLTTLEIDYMLIFENLLPLQSAAIRPFENCRSRMDLKIIMFLDDFMLHEGFQRLAPNDWRFLKQLYPHLQIELKYGTVSPSLKRTEFFILPYMPITALYYRFEYCCSSHSFMEIDAFLKHLLHCKINEHLVSLHLKWELPIPHLDSTFIPFLNDFKKLERLSLCLIYPINDIEVLLKYLLKNRPECLKEFALTIFGIKQKNIYTMLGNLFSKYVPLLKSVKLNVKISLHL